MRRSSEQGGRISRMKLYCALLIGILSCFLPCIARANNFGQAPVITNELADYLKRLSLGKNTIRRMRELGMNYVQDRWAWWKTIRRELTGDIPPHMSSAIM